MQTEIERIVRLDPVKFFAEPRTRTDVGIFKASIAYLSQMFRVEIRPHIVIGRKLEDDVGIFHGLIDMGREWLTVTGKTKSEGGENIEMMFRMDGSRQVMITGDSPIIDRVKLERQFTHLAVLVHVDYIVVGDETNTISKLMAPFDFIDMEDDHE